MTFQDSHPTIFTFRKGLDLLVLVQRFGFPFEKISKFLKTADTGLKISQASKNIWKDHTPNFCRNLVIFRCKNICQKKSVTRSSTVI